MYKYIFLFSILFINCNNDDDVVVDSMDFPKLINRYIYSSNDITSHHVFIYNENNGFVSKVIMPNNSREFKYNGNLVEEKIYSNSTLRNIVKYSYINGVYKRQFLDKDYNLISYTENKIVDNKIVESKGYDSNSNLEFHLTSTFENNGLKEISYNHLTNETSTTSYYNKTIKNRISAFAYLVHDNETLKKEVITTDDSHFYEYMYNTQDYPIETRIFNQNRELIQRVVNEYE